MVLRHDLSSVQSRLAAGCVPMCHTLCHPDIHQTYTHAHTPFASFGPARTYPIGISITLVMVTTMYALPLFIAIQTNPDWRSYVDGTLGQVAYGFSFWMVTFSLGLVLQHLQPLAMF